VRVLSLARTLFALLAFQLALGMQVGVAYASAMSTPPASAHESSAANSSDAPCPMHNASSPTHNANASSHTSAHAKAPLEKSADKHECCKSSGCQGQCGNVPLASNVSAIRGATATAAVQPIRATRVAVAPTDTHFRPPIAS
jgi:hypothetical protein